MHLRLLAALLLLTPAPLLPQGVRPRVALPFADFVAMPDTIGGLMLAASPNQLTRQGSQTRITWLRFHPDEVRAWVLQANELLEAVSTGPAPRQRAVVLRAEGLEGGRLALNWQPAYERRDRLFISVQDADEREKSWDTFVSVADAARLLSLLYDQSWNARWVPLPRDSTAPRPAAEVDEAPSVRNADALLWPSDRALGRVWARFVVDSTGRVAPESVDIVLRDSPTLEEAARATIARLRYRPGKANGRPVSVYVFQSFIWRDRR